MCLPLLLLPSRYSSVSDHESYRSHTPESLWQVHDQGLMLHNTHSFLAVVTLSIFWRLNFIDCRGLVLQLCCVGLPCVPLSGHSCLSLSRYTTGCTTCGWALSLASLWGCFKVLARILWMPSHLLHESAILRDQVCPSSNKEGCLLAHPLSNKYIT